MSCLSTRRVMDLLLSYAPLINSRNVCRFRDTGACGEPKGDSIQTRPDGKPHACHPSSHYPSPASSLVFLSHELLLGGRGLWHAAGFRFDVAQSGMASSRCNGQQSCGLQLLHRRLPQVFFSLPAHGRACRPLSSSSGMRQCSGIHPKPIRMPRIGPSAYCVPGVPISGPGLSTPLRGVGSTSSLWRRYTQVTRTHIVTYSMPALRMQEVGPQLSAFDFRDCV